MCQAYRGEASYFNQMLTNARKKGYSDFKKGKTKAENPEYLDSAITHWDYGWDIANNNRELW